MSTLENIISANSAMQCNSEACILGSKSRANLAYGIVAYVCVCVCVCHYCWCQYRYCKMDDREIWDLTEQAGKVLSGKDPKPTQDEN